ncbi:MAG: PTS system mannose/fructose/sorbose family transporter subunit IID [Proteobacteria bacterium]|nr:PTS system mannose/fructose/sorbose family transporter subunit IID [Pseudomonadota bacterium]MBU1595935.1 PTS system mannose/fructose/sorbose family transporter subunit IID [Pseudomonadota bacterium]
MPGLDAFWSERGKAYLRCFLRTYLVGASMNPRGLMSVGILYAMQPGLWFIHPDPKAREQALKRYARHFSSHPFWVPCLVGIFLAVEQDIAGRRLPPDALQKVKNTTSYTLSAIGDSVFAGSLLIFWALCTSCLLLLGQRALPLGIGIFFFLGLQVFRVYTFLGGLRRGFSFLGALKNWDLINWGRRIKFLNAALLLLLWSLLFPARDFVSWAWGLGALGLAGVLTLRPILPRWLLAGFVLGTLTAIPWLMQRAVGGLPTGLP